MSKIKVAVYGTLMQGQPNHRVMLDAGGQYIGDFVTPQQFQMFSLGAFPALAVDGEPETRIKVQVFEIDDSKLSILDRLEGYPHFYDRSQICINNQDVWIYHQPSSNFADDHPRVPDGDWAGYVEMRTGLQMTEELIGH